MKVRLNKRRILSNLRQNNHYAWAVAPYIANARRLQKLNERIKEALDKL